MQYKYSEIKVANRIRKEYNGIEELAASIKLNGLIQPLVINRHGELIAGGRRWTAIGTLGWEEVPVVMIETLDEPHLRRLEMAENLDRQDLTWQEIVEGIDTYHDIRLRDTKGAQKQSQTAEELGYSQRYVSAAITLASELRKGNKAVIEAPGISDALKVMVKSTEDTLLQELAKRTLPTAVPAGNGQNTEGPGGTAVPGTLNPAAVPNLFAGLVSSEAINVPLSKMMFNEDAISFLSRLPTESVDHIITDPPYGIDMDNLQQENLAAPNVSRIEDTHDVEANIGLLKNFIPAAYEALKETGFLIFWCDSDHWNWMRELAELTGFKVQRWPWVWAKTTTCKNGAPQYNTCKNHEIAMLCRKPKAILPKPVLTSFYVGPNDADRSTHPFVKPGHVWQPLIEAVSIIGETICDPFAGEGSCALQALKMNRKVLTCELAPNHYAKSIEKVKQHYMGTFQQVRFE